MTLRRFSFFPRCAALLSLSLATLFLAGCLRYTPSRDELADDEAIVVNEEAFYGFETEQKARLETLVASRNAESAASTSEDYRVGAEDLLEINVFDVEELNTTARVRPSGFISLPMLGAVKVGGMTEEEIQKELSKRLEEYLQVPQVHVFISEYAAHKVSVIGEVQKPGAYSLKRGDYTLIELLSEAGGRTDKASGIITLIPAPTQTVAQLPNVAQVQQALNNRSNNGIEIYFDDLVGSASRAPTMVPLRPGDTIVVPEAGTFEVAGDVHGPGS
ncbi:MAG: polysaccharide export protein, partial [Bdellovibrionales bacterium]|nr:polysaccharide export protein [Bdellovibrionales bacterium]